MLSCRAKKNGLVDTSSDRSVKGLRDKDIEPEVSEGPLETQCLDGPRNQEIHRMLNFQISQKSLVKRCCPRARMKGHGWVKT